MELGDGRKLEYDTPRCALLAWRTGEIEPQALFVQDYYDRSWKKGDEVLFVASSDVIGPMGADLVPVDRARAQQFAREHSGTRPLPIAELSLQLLRELR
jgi:nitrous oxide reductase accessory protein NosL